MTTILIDPYDAIGKLKLQCEDCGYYYSYDLEDIIKIHNPTNKYFPIWSEVKCPQCGTYNITY